ncbi:hypothetical protein E4T56_gene13803 [Termitomyces sp. T112]|nr:hypothetical protein E4T56_gene13803 [Termitomyces sp. T112]
MPQWLGKQSSSYNSSRDGGSGEFPLHQDAGGLERVEATAHLADAYQFVNDFYDAHQDIIGSNSRNIADVNLDTRNIEDSLNGFTDSANTIIKGLTALGHVHPFIGVAVGAFALVVTLDLTRRENDRKVLAVKVQMQDLMKVFFELRHISDSHAKGPDGLSIADRIEDRVQTIAKDIKECGSACDVYLKKGFLVKTIKATIWENRLSDFATTFIEHRHALELALQVHISLGVDSANRKLETQGDRLQDIDEKLDMLLLFRKLDTARERDLQKFLEAHGGAKACILDESLLEELITRSGDSLSRFSGREIGRRTNELPDMKKRLLKELQEDIEETFCRNMVVFERKLDMQSKQLSDLVQDETDHILNTLLAGAHDRIMDPDLSKIWKDMGWKGSVKARHFVLALHDYYSDQLSSGDSPRMSQVSGLPSPETPTRSSFLVMSKKRLDDRWALAYINAAYVQPILEAVDDDGTGFVSIKEVNTFVAERPENWTLPHWIAYWAVGWQASMSHYKELIYELVRTIYQTLEHVLPSNRKAVDEYLFHPSFWRIELLLRSTRSVNPKILSDVELVKMTESYQRYEEERLDANLSDVAYELDTTATVALITGAGRIERYVFPLIYLLLRRHLQVIRLACKHVLDTEEFVTLNESLVSILLAVDQRIESLEAIFKQTHLDVQARLGNFAFGIFQLSYGDIKRIPSDNSFATWTNPEGESSSTLVELEDDAKILAGGVPQDIVKYGIQDGYSVTNYYEFDTPTQGASIEFTQIEGTWSGHYRREFGGNWVSCILRISIRLASQPRITGKGEDFAGAFEFIGLAQSYQTYLDFTFIVEDEEEGTTRTCAGRLDRASNTIIARWKTAGKRGGQDEHGESFTLQRTPPNLLRYRYTPQQFAEDPVRSRWSFVCSAALHQAQAALWSRRFFEERFRERKRYVELTTRDLIVQMGLTPQVPLTQVERGELEYLRQELDPSEARFYQALSDFEIQKLPWHPTWGCDGCGRQITKSRILCIQCMSDDLSDNIDLCMSCIDKTPVKRGFTHDTSHAVVKVQQTLHDYHIVKVVEAARAAFEKTKTLFATLEPAGITKRNADEYSASSRPRCTYCERDILLPCWVCVICTTGTFICPDCDSNRVIGRNTRNGHLHTHALVRIRDIALPVAENSHSERYLALENRLDVLEQTVAEQFAALEARENERFAALEAQVDSRLSGLESRIETRLQGLEVVLRQIAAQTAALPAVYGQVVREYVKSPSVH